MTKAELRKEIVERLDEIADLACDYVKEHGIDLGDRQISMCIHPVERWTNCWLYDKNDELVFDICRRERG